MAVGGLGFGALANKRPFGDQLLFHPLVVFFLLASLALLALRVMLRRPVPEVISDRALMLGCIAGLVAFLAGNFLGVYGLNFLK